jgi:hypothetical protein
VHSENFVLNMKSLICLAAIASISIAVAAPTDVMPIDSDGYGPYLDKQPERCPPPGFTSKSNFNLTSYVSRRW